MGIGEDGFEFRWARQASDGFLTMEQVDLRLTQLRDHLALQRKATQDQVTWLQNQLAERERELRVIKGLCGGGCRLHFDHSGLCDHQ